MKFVWEAEGVGKAEAEMTNFEGLDTLVYEFEVYEEEKIST